MNKDIKTLKNIFTETAAPDTNFINKLENELVLKHKEKPQLNLFNILFMQIPQNALRVGIISFAAISVLSITGGATYFAYNKYFKQNEFENQDAILAQIAKKNQKQSNENSTRDAGAMLAGDEKIGLWMPMNRDYNYSQRTTLYDLGPKSSQCNIIIPNEGKITKEENYQFYITKDEWYPSYSKYVTYINNNDIYTYSLDAKDSQWLYNGGQYAVNILNAQKVSPMARTGLAEDTVLTTKQDTAEVLENNEEVDPIKARFGDDVKILDKQNIDGKEYYKIQWSFDIGCKEVITNDSVSYQADTKAVNVALADSETFEIKEESLYLEKVNEGNRVYTSKYSEQKKNVQFNDISNIFKFDLNTDVKKYDMKSFDYNSEYKNALINYIANKAKSIVYISNNKYESQNASSSTMEFRPSSESYLFDRNFYSSKSYGQKMYEDALNMYKPYISEDVLNPILNLSYSSSKLTDMNWINMNIFDNKYSVEKILNSQYFEKTKDEGTLDLTLNNSIVKARVFSRINEEVASQPSTDSADDSTILREKELEKVQEYKDVIVIFDYENNSYSIQVSINNKSDINTISKNILLKVVQASDKSTLNKVLQTTENNDKAILY